MSNVQSRVSSDHDDEEWRKVVGTKVLEITAEIGILLYLRLIIISTRKTYDFTLKSHHHQR